MSQGQQDALNVTEDARMEAGESYARSLFMGQSPAQYLFGYAPESGDKAQKTEVFLSKLDAYLSEHVDADEIDRTGEIPDDVIEGLAKLGAFGIKVPEKFGGVGLSQEGYCKAATLIGSYCANVFALLSVHQSVGVPQPLMIFGTEEQKAKYLPRVAGGEISAFALTEEKVGSDPARMECTATPSECGSYYTLNGTKLWCSNGLKAGVIIVTARTPSVTKNGRERKQITAFILEMDSPGVELLERCRFMGLRALYNGVVRFTDVKIPAENIVGGEGRGLKVALTTLNAGRLSIPASCLGISKACLSMSRHWATERHQWGAPIIEHAAVADKVRRIASHTFALEAMIQVTANLVDRHPEADIRMEAAMCKMWGTETTWDIINHAVQIRGGRGYETADSLQNRGEIPMPLERMLRDARVNTIFEGSSEIMRLFIMREALDGHLTRAGAAANTQLPFSERFQTAISAAPFYATWYPSQWLPALSSGISSHHDSVTKHMRYVRRTAKLLARRLFHQMLRHGPSLERKQILLARFADIGTELFVIASTCAYADHQLTNGIDCTTLLDDAVMLAKQRIRHSFNGISSNPDDHGYDLAQSVKEQSYEWLENPKL